MAKLAAVEPEGEWRSLPAGMQVHERYTSLARQVMEYERMCFGAWRDAVDSAVLRFLKQPILVRDADTGECLRVRVLVAV